MRHAANSDKNHATRTSAARAAAALAATAVVLTLFGLMTGHPEAGSASTPQGGADPAPVAAAAQAEPAAPEGDGNVFMYY